ncbi:MAG: hypothetical protein NTV34_18280, partial [Proteobacteria bacterium]|nr:hypothetical protein [Pseudomonadota bacterium]
MTSQYASILAFGLFITVQGCTPPASSPDTEAAAGDKKPGTGTSNGLPSNTTPYNSGSSQTSGALEIQCSNDSSKTFRVNLNQPISLTFTARTGSGIMGQITSIVASPQPGNFSVSGATVTFTPTSTAELSGSLTVTASQTTSSDTTIPGGQGSTANTTSTSNTTQTNVPVPNTGTQGSAAVYPVTKTFFWENAAGTTNNNGNNSSTNGGSDAFGGIMMTLMKMLFGGGNSNGYGQNGYGQNGYGQNGYGQNGYGQNGYG